MMKQRVIKGFTRKPVVPMLIPKTDCEDKGLARALATFTLVGLSNSFVSPRYTAITEAEVCANHLHEFLNSFAEIKHRTTDLTSSLSVLRFDLLTRILYPSNYQEMQIQGVVTTTHLVAHGLNLPERSAHSFSSVDAFCDYIVRQVIEKIGRGEWGSF